MAIGIISISIFDIAITGIQRLFNLLRKAIPENKIDLSNPAVTGLFQYQNKLERRVYLTVLPFVVISEDLIYRGYLVLMMGSKTQTYLPWTILSVLLSVIIHLYQGRKAAYMLYQAASALFLVGLTIWTGNILTSIIAHLYYDIFWTLGVWKREKKTKNQPIKISKSKSFAYSIFITTNLLVLLISFLAVAFVW